MDNKSLWHGVADVLNLLKEYSEKNKPPRPSATELQRLSGWTVFAGGVIYFVGEIVRQVGDQDVSSVRLAYVVLSILGLILFFAGALAAVVDCVQTTRRPFVEHVDRIIGALDREYELIGALLRFDTATLELACERLSLESTKVATRLGMIGGGDGLRASLVGVVTLSAALLSQYEIVVHGLTMKSLAFFGVALLVGLSIGGLLVRYGASKSDYYCGLIRIAIQLKACGAKESREPFVRRIGAKGRRGD